jgi:sigma-E factor negative regulatory protein RseC
MIEEQAVVIGVERDMALLEIVRSKPCGLCGQTRGCGISLWGRLLGHRSSVVRADNQISAQAGDNVVVGIDEKALLASSLAAYGVPLISLLIGAGLGGSFASAPASADFYALGGAGLGLALGFLWLRGHAAGRGMRSGYRPVVLRQSNTIVDGRICHRG